MINTTVALKSNLDPEVIQSPWSWSPAIFSNTTSQPLLDQPFWTSKPHWSGCRSVWIIPTKKIASSPAVRYVSDDFYTVKRSYVHSELHLLGHMLSWLLLRVLDEMVDTGMDNGINLLRETLYIAGPTSSRRIHRLGLRPLYSKVAVLSPANSSWLNVDTDSSRTRITKSTYLL